LITLSIPPQSVSMGNLTFKSKLAVFVIFGADLTEIAYSPD
jgi:hypothetical protein